MQLEPQPRQRLGKQIVRILAIMQALYAHREGLSADEVAEALQTQYCKRTIRRDLATLCAMNYARRVDHTYSHASGLPIRVARYELTPERIGPAVRDSIPPELRRKR